MTRSSLRCALTLLELLVVIAIIAVLIGLLVPAVQRTRSSAARIQCGNNLKQLGLALHNYHDTLGSLPPGCSYLNGASPQPHMSWLTRLLPYLEQNALWEEAYNAFQQNKFFETPPHFAICKRIMPTFICPADRHSQQTKEFPNFAMAFTDYLGVWGTSHRQRDGVLFLDSQVRLLEITDGTTNTLIVGERPPSADGFLGWWYAGWGQSKDGSGEMLLGVAEWNDHPRYRKKCPKGSYSFTAGTNGICDLFHYWSYHSGGANFLFCDGSVHFIPYSAAPIMPALATRAGGDVVTIDF